MRGIIGAADAPLASIEPPVSIARLAALLARARAVLCHDSGPMHMAAAVGTPVVALFGSQSRALWGPLGGGNRVLQAPMPCGGACVAPDACDRTNAYRSYCVRRIGEEEVFAALKDVLR
jgi:ADP-heptose:LPS heptosyltransferase